MNTQNTNGRQILKYIAKHPIKSTKLVGSAIYNLWDTKYLLKELGKDLSLSLGIIVSIGLANELFISTESSNQWQFRQDGKTNIVENYHGGLTRIIDTNGDWKADITYRSVPRVGYHKSETSSEIDKIVFSKVTGH